MSRAVESWLKSEDHEKFASAAVKCEHPGGFCLSDGFCHRDGQCFRSGRAAMIAACRLIEKVGSDEPSDVRANMMHAAKLLRQAWDAEIAEIAS